MLIWILRRNCNIFLRVRATGLSHASVIIHNFRNISFTFPMIESLFDYPCSLFSHLSNIHQLNVLFTRCELCMYWKLSSRLMLQVLFKGSGKKVMLSGEEKEKIMKITFFFDSVPLPLYLRHRSDHIQHEHSRIESINRGWIVRQ